MHSPRSRARGGRVPYVPAAAAAPLAASHASTPLPSGSGAAPEPTTLHAQALPAAVAQTTHARLTVHPPPSQTHAQVAPAPRSSAAIAAAAAAAAVAALPASAYELIPSSTTDKEPLRSTNELHPISSFASDPLPVAAAASSSLPGELVPSGFDRAPSSSSATSSSADKFTTVSSTVQPRLDPSSPVAVSNRPLPRVLHRATSITPATATDHASSMRTMDPASATATPASPTYVYQKPAPITNLQAAVTQRASLSQMATPPPATRMLSAPSQQPAASFSPPPPVLVPSLSQLDGALDGPPSVHRAQSVGSNTYEAARASDVPAASELPLTRTQSAHGDGAVPPVIVTPLPASPSSSSDEPHPTPSPKSSSSQKRAHASWSLPARRESGASGFNSSSFRPHLQKDLYASGANGGTSPAAADGPRRSLTGHPSNGGPPGRLSLVSENSVIEMHDLSIMIAPPTPVHSAQPQGSAQAAVAAGSSPLLAPSRSPSSAGSGGRPFPHTVIGGLTSAAAASAVAAKGTSMLRQSPRQASIEEARLKAVGGSHSHSSKPILSPSAARSSPASPTAASRSGGGGRRRGGGGGGGCCRSFLVCLNSFPTRIPFSKHVAMALFHPLYLLVSLLLTLVAVFALDFTLAFLPKSYDMPCDWLLLAIGALWSVEILLCSLTLPGFFLMSAWWWVDAMAIVSIVVDIAPLDGLSLGKAALYSTYFASQPSQLREGHGSFVGLAGGHASAQIWLCLHYLRMVRLCKFWNGIQAFSGAFSLEALYARIEAAYGRKRPPSAAAAAESSVSSPRHSRNSPFHKASTLGLHLTNRMQKKIAGCFVGLIVIFTLCMPAAHSVVQVPNSCAMEYTEMPFAAAAGSPLPFARMGSDSVGGGGGHMLQWSIGFLDSLYASAVYSSAPERTLNPSLSDQQLRVEQHADYKTLRRVGDDFARSFGDSSNGAGGGGAILALSVGAPRFNYSTPASANFVAPSFDLVRRDDAELTRLRDLETVTFRCGRSTLTISQWTAVHTRACWNLLLLSSLWLLYLLLMSLIGYDLNTLISHPLERMNRSIRKMAGTVLFLASSDEGEITTAAEDTTEEDEEDEDTGSAGPRRKSKLTASSSSWFLNNLGHSQGRAAGGSLPSCMSSEAARNARWAAPSILPLHCEFDRLEEVLAKMSSVFNLLPGGLGSLFGFSSSGGEDGSDESKARRMMVGSRRTEIKTRDSILTIDVVERPINNPSTSPRRASTNGHGAPGSSDMAELKLHGHRRDSATAPAASYGEGEFISSSTLLHNSAPATGANGHRAAPSNASVPARSGGGGGLVQPMVNPAGRASFIHSSGGSSSAASSPVLGAVSSAVILSSLHPELRSLESLLSDPFASLYFKQYLHKKFCLETWSFYDQVNKYRARMQSWAFRIFHQFVVAGAPHEINIHSVQRQAISEGIFHPSLDLFDKAQKEIYKLMKTNFVDFLASQAVVSYVAAKESKVLTINVREEHI